MTLLELAERCEQATGPDRELDARIFWETGEFVRLAGSEYASRRDVEAFGVFYGRNPKKAPADLTWADVGNRCPNYTASLDAAMTLVPENHAFNLNNGPCHWICLGRQKPMGRADVHYLNPRYDGEGDSWLTVSANAATPALALCAASLRARNEQVTI